MNKITLGKHRYILGFRLLMLVLLALAFIMSMPSKALAGNGNPMFVFDGKAKTAGTIKLSMSWVVDHTTKEETVTVNVAKDDDDATVATNATKALNANAKIAADWTFTKDSSWGYHYSSGTPKQAEGKTKALRVTVENTDGKVTGLSMSAGIDPVNGIVRFDLSGIPSSGETTIAADGIAVATSTAGKSIQTIKNQLIDAFNAAGKPAYLEPGTGYIRIDNVNVDATPGLAGLSGGATFETSDPSVGGMAQVESVLHVSASGLLALGLLALSGGALLAWRLVPAGFHSKTDRFHSGPTED